MKKTQIVSVQKRGPSNVLITVRSCADAYEPIDVEQTWSDALPVRFPHEVGQVFPALPVEGEPSPLYTVAPPPPKVATFAVTPKRFGVLAVIAFMGAAGMMQWLSTAPDSETLGDYFGGLSDFWFQFANGSFYLGALGGVFVALYFLTDAFGIFYPMVVASWFVVIGAFIRIWSFDTSLAGFIILCIGNFSTGMSAGTLILMCIYMPFTWFGASEQTTATGLTLGGAGVGAVMGYILGAVMITDSSNTGLWVGLNAILLGLAVIGIVLIYIYVDDRPAQDPSLAASLFRLRPRYLTWETFQYHVAEHTHALFWILVVQMVLGVSVYFTLQTTLQTSMNDRGYSRYEQNVTGILFQVIGLLGTIGWSYVVDQFKILRAGAFISWWLSLTMFVLLGLRVATDSLGSNIATLYVISSLAGLVFSSAPPIMLQLACNTVFPIPPAWVSVCLFMLSQLGTVIVLLTTRAFGGDTAWYIMFGVLATATLLSISNWFMPLRRDDVESGKTELEPEPDLRHVGDSVV